MDQAAVPGRERLAEEARQPAFWRETLAPYARPDLRLSGRDLLTSVVPYLVLTAAQYLLMDVSIWLVLVLAVPAAGFLLRTFIVFHDCAHGSFLPWRWANAWLGMFCGLLVWSPFHSWRREHAVHHATAGDLDSRGTGDVETMTVAEYRTKPLGARVGYRLFRNPFVMLGLGPIWALMIEPRLIPKEVRARFGLKIALTDVVLGLAIAALVLAFGWKAFLLVQIPAALIAGSAGVWLFYVQHQFEGVYWVRKDDWSYADAALRGSSYLRLPKVFQFFTGNIGFHHVHHLNARIPNYHLQRAHDAVPILRTVPELTARQGLKAMRLKLYDEERGRLVTWAEVRAPRARAATEVAG
ncbi:MAG TPA: fatty acid desaturase [Solirubrobacteraceae bacterium]